MTQEKILDKLGKIKAMAESAKAIGNEAEAQAFAAMLQNLLLKHKLEMTDIQYQAEMQDEPIIEHHPESVYRDGKRFYKDYPDVEIVNRRREWAENLAATVARFYSCSILVSPGRSIIHFVGHKSNVAIVEYLFVTMMRAAEKMSNQAAKTFRARQREALGGPGATPQGYRESWLEGFITRIAQRLEEERNKFGNQSGNMALVRVNKEAIAVKNYMQKFDKNKKAAHLGGRSHFNRDGYEQGKRAANDVNLRGNAVSAGQPNKQLE